MGEVKKYETMIDGCSYETTSFTATEALVMLPKMVNLIGFNTLKLLLETTEDQREMLLSSPDIIAGIVSNIAAQTSDGGLLVLKDLMAKTICQQVKIGEATGVGNVQKHFDSHFTGRLLHMVNVCIWVASVSFTGL